MTVAVDRVTEILSTPVEYSAEEIAALRKIASTIQYRSKTGCAHVATKDAASIANALMGLCVPLDSVTDAIVDHVLINYLGDEENGVENGKVSADYAMVIANVLVRYMAKNRM